MPRPAVLRLAPEYGCWPTWDDATGENLDPADLDLPPDLLARLLAWDGAFQATLDLDDPLNSDFASLDAEQGWRAEGRALFAALSKLVGPWAARLRL